MAPRQSSPSLYRFSMYRYFATIFYLLLVTLPDCAHAGGTLSADEVIAVVKGNSELAAAIEGFEFRCTAFAEVRLSNETVPHLGGKRIGPYTL
jgi:hypothetical protein